MSVLVLAKNGFLNYRKRRKNLTLVISSMFFLILFFLNLFHTMSENLSLFWVDELIGGDVITASGTSDFDIYKNIPPESYVSFPEFLKTNPAVTAYSPRLRIGGLLEKKQTATLIIIGIDYDRETAINRHISIVEGRIFDPAKNEIVLPENIMLDIGAGLGDDIVLSVMTIDGYVNYERLTVTGILETSTALTLIMGGSFMAYMPIDTVRTAIMAPEDQASEILVKHDTKISGNYTRTEGIKAFGVSRVLSIAYAFLEIVLFLFVIIITVGIVYYNVMLSTIERRREIGTYLAYGAKKSWIFGVLFSELVAYVAYCSLFGTACAFLFTLLVNLLQIIAINPVTNIIMSTTKLVVGFRIEYILYTFAIITGIVLSGAFFPIRKVLSDIDVIATLNRIK